MQSVAAPSPESTGLQNHGDHVRHRFRRNHKLPLSHNLNLSKTFDNCRILLPYGGQKFATHEAEASRYAKSSASEDRFEIKWDGIRALLYVESNGYRLVSRRGYDLTGQFPELAALAGLPAGTVLDGELVVLRNGKPNRSLVGCRQQLASTHKIKAFGLLSVNRHCPDSKG